MKKVSLANLLVSSIFVMLILSTCKTVQPCTSETSIDTMQSNDTVIVVDTLYFGIDNVEAYFECDSERNVMLKQYETLKRVIDTMKPVERVRVVTKIKNNEQIKYVIAEKPIIQEKKVIPVWAYVSLIIIGILCITLLLALLK